MPIFFLSAAVFSLQILLSPVVTTILTGLGVQLVLAAPIMAFAFATFALAVFVRKKRGIPTWLPTVSVLGAILGISLCFLFLALIQNMIDARVIDIANLNPNRFLAQIQAPIAPRFYFPLMAAIAIPYFFYALFFAGAVATATPGAIPKLVALELGGAAFGWLAGVMALEKGGFMVALLLAQILATAAVFGLSIQPARLRRFVLLFSIALLFVTAAFLQTLEPRRNLNLAAADLKMQKSVRELRQSWTTYSKVQTLEVQGEGGNYKIIAMGGGGGIAGLYPYDAKGPPPVVATTEIAKAFHPQKALVIFAGAGRELMALYSQGVKDITGIELNPGVLRDAFKDEPTNLAEFLNVSKAKLLQGDARVFLQTTPENYDLILYSWSGATVGHYSGAVMRTTQYEFTEEALASAWNRLRPDGILLVMGGVNKINLLASLRKVAGGIDWSQSVALLALPYAQDFKSGWDEFALVVKKGGITASEISELRNIGAVKDLHESLPGRAPAEYSLVLAPNYSADLKPFQLLRDSLSERDADVALRNLRAQFGAEFSSHSDDRPFAYNISAAYGIFSLNDPTVSVAVALALLVLLLVLGSAATGELTGAVFFTCIGFFSAALQILAAYKFVLYLSNPTIAVLLAVGGLITASAFGSWAALRGKQTRTWIPSAVCGLFAGLWCLSWRWSGIQEVYFRFPAPLRAVALTVPLLIPGALASMLYVRALQSRAARLGPAGAARALAVDSLGATLAILWIPLMVETAGFQNTALVLFLILAGALLAARDR